MMTKTKASLTVAALGLITAGVAWATTYTPLTFDTSDNRQYTGSNETIDWDVGAFKSECSSTTKVNGVSATAIGMRPDLRAHSILCGTYPDSGRVHRGDNEQMRWITDADDRGDSATGNWDPTAGVVHAECKFDEVVTGVSQGGPQSALTMSRILCSSSRGTLTATTCQTLVFSSVSDNRLSTASGDWASGYSKNECAPNQILKGVSAKASTGEIHALLCCNYALH